MAEKTSRRSSGATKKRTGGGTKKTGSSTRKRSASQSRPSARAASNGDHSAREIVIDAMRQLQDLIGRPIEGVTSIEKNGREWTLTFDVLELERVPNTTDVLGRDEVTVDKDGDLIGARRTRRYVRAEAGED